MTDATHRVTEKLHKPTKNTTHGQNIQTSQAFLLTRKIYNSHKCVYSQHNVLGFVGYIAGLNLCAFFSY